MAEASTINLARYRFHFRVQSPIVFSHYAGSALRGVFGHSLRQLACMTKAKTCQACVLKPHCLYTQIFEPIPNNPPNQATDNHAYGLTLNKLPVPYVIEAKELGTKEYAKGQELTVDMVLMGEAIKQIAVIILAWERALKRGIGNERGIAQLESVSVVEQNDELTSIYATDNTQIKNHTSLYQLHSTSQIDSANQAKDLSIEVQTPLMIKHNGAIVDQKNFTAAIFIKTLIRRISLLNQCHNLLPDATMHAQFSAIENIRALNKLGESLAFTHQLHWHSWVRYSSRQRQTMRLGGVVGVISLKQVPEQLMPYLTLGQWCHIGKETAFGLGKYSIIKD